MNWTLRPIFISLYLQEFDVPLTRAGLDRLRRVEEEPTLLCYVKTLRLDAGYFISTGPTTPDDKVKDIIRHSAVQEPAIKWNNHACELVLRGTIANTLRCCLQNFTELEGFVFVPPDLDEVFTANNNNTLSRLWKELLDTIIPIVLEKASKVRSIEIEDAFWRCCGWRSVTPAYRTNPIPVGAPLSIISRLFCSTELFKRLSTLKLSIGMRESKLNENYATQLRDGLQTLESLKSLHLSFKSRHSSAPVFFNDLIQGLDQLPVKHFGLTLLTPLPGSLPMLLSKCKNIESITLLLVGLSLQEWNNGLKQPLKTLVCLDLRYINVNNQGVDFSVFGQKGDGLWAAELVLANISNMDKDLQKMWASPTLTEQPWTVDDVLF
jgi:hypothetical protein